MQLLHRVLADVQLMLRRPPRLQYAALCYRVRTGHPLEILLITSRDTGRWVIPKGWPIKGKRAHEVAAREAFEEAGVKGSCERAPIGHYVYRKKLDSGLKVSCTVRVFAMKVAGLRGNFPEKGERKLVWFEYREAARRVAERSLRDQILRFGSATLP